MTFWWEKCERSGSFFRRYAIGKSHLLWVKGVGEEGSAEEGRRRRERKKSNKNKNCDWDVWLILLFGEKCSHFLLLFAHLMFIQDGEHTTSGPRVADPFKFCSAPPSEVGFLKSAIYQNSNLSRAHLSPFIKISQPRNFPISWPLWCSPGREAPPWMTQCINTFAE